MQVGGSAVDVVLAERRTTGDVVRVEDVCLLAGLTRQPLLGETLVLHQQGVVGVLATLWLGQRILGEHKQKGQMGQLNSLAWGLMFNRTHFQCLNKRDPMIQSTQSVFKMTAVKRFFFYSYLKIRFKRIKILHALYALVFVCIFTDTHFSQQLLQKLTNEVKTWKCARLCVVP